MEEGLRDILRRLQEEAEEPKSTAPKLPLFGEIAVLKDALRSFNTRHDFRPGMIVRQKPSCKCYSVFSDNAIAIVVALLEEPVCLDTEGQGSPYFRQPLDMIIGERARDGTLALYHIDSRRFEPVAEDGA